MTLTEVHSLFDYCEWANARTFEMAAALTPDELTKDMGSSFPSVLDTLAHIVGGEWVWLERWQGRAVSTFPDWVRTPDFADVRARLTTVETERRDFFAALTDGHLDQPVSYSLFNGTIDTQSLETLVRHITNHSTYHRGQIATFMRQLGHKPVSTDLIVFARQQRG